VDADKGLTCGIQVDGIYRTCFVTLSAPDTQLFLDDHAAALSLRVGTGRASLSAGSGIASQADGGFKAG
jgi:hypothetical protein